MMNADVSEDFVSAWLVWADPCVRRDLEQREY